LAIFAYMGSMQQTIAILAFETDGEGLHEITEQVTSGVRETPIRVGILTLFCQHTSAGLLVTENAAPAVRRDLLRWLGAAAPEGDGYEHDDEGPDDMPAHIRTMLTGNSLTLPVADGKIMLGTWQGVFIAEHRRAAHRRMIVAHLAGN
jgi:secondary thiamine-phosphate synthase enzyme